MSATAGVNRDTLEYVHQVVVRINVMKLAGADKALDNTKVFSAEFSPTKLPVLPTHSNLSNSPFKMVGV